MHIQNGACARKEPTTSEILRGSRIRIEHERHALQDPVRLVLAGVQIGLHHHADAHGVAPLLRDVQRHADGAVQLELVRLDGDDLHDGQILHEYLGRLPDEELVLNVPSGAFNGETDHVAAVLEPLAHILTLGELGDLSEERRLVERPAVAPARGLHERGGVRLWDGEAREPHDLWLPLGDPCLVLRVAVQVVRHPRAEHLVRLRRELAPHHGQLAVEQVRAESIQFGRHGDLALDGLLELAERLGHLDVELIPPLQLLHEHHEDGREAVCLEVLA